MMRPLQCRLHQQTEGKESTKLTTEQRPEKKQKKNRSKLSLPFCSVQSRWLGCNWPQPSVCYPTAGVRHPSPASRDITETIIIILVSSLLAPCPAQVESFFFLHSRWHLAPGVKLRTPGFRDDLVSSPTPGAHPWVPILACLLHTFLAV